MTTPTAAQQATKRLKTAMTEAATDKAAAVQAQIEKATECLFFSAAQDIQQAIEVVKEEEDPVLMELLEENRFDEFLDRLALPMSMLHNRLIELAKQNPSLFFLPSEENEEKVRAAAYQTIQNILNAKTPGLDGTLRAGRVKPQFHALFLPETFLGKNLSFDVATAGEVGKERKTLELDDLGKNLNEAIVVDENGHERGISSIFDDGVESSWKFRPELTAFAVELVNTDAEMLGEGIECTTVSFIPYELNPSDRKSLTLLTRPESRGVVSNIFFGFLKNPKGGAVTAITGLPGIGKSWTLFYALQQALLYDGANVLFFFQKAGDAVMFLRRNNRIYAWSSKRRQFADSYLFKRLDVLVLLDPTEAKDGGASFLLGPMKLLYAASNNEIHFKNAAGKNNDLLAYLGPPLDNELQVIISFLDPDLPPLTIDERKRNVGNLIRYILDIGQYQKRLLATSKAVEKCAKDPSLLKKALQDDGMSSNGESTIPGTLFYVSPTRPHQVDSIGYDGQGVQYRKPVVTASNEKVYAAILKAGREIILSYWGKVSSADYARMGHEVEKLFIQDLTNENGMVMKRYLQSSQSKAKSKGASTTKNLDQATKAEEKGTESELEIKSGLKFWKNVSLTEVAQALSKTDVVAKVVDGEPLIHVAGPGRKVFQVTVSGEHGMALEALKRLCQSTGYIIDGNVVGEGEVDKLEFYWVVPCGVASKWKAKAPFKYREAAKDKERDADKRLVNECLEQHVVQYVLPLTIESPQPIYNLQTSFHETQ